MPPFHRGRCTPTPFHPTNKMTGKHTGKQKINTLHAPPSPSNQGDRQARLKRAQPDQGLSRLLNALPLPQLTKQVTGKQDLNERNLIKVSLDYYLQGFCASSLVLRSSAFYSAAVARTEMVRPFLIANATASKRYELGPKRDEPVPKQDEHAVQAQPGRCALRLQRATRREAGLPYVRASLAACQAQECELRRCNLEGN